jgi:DNA-binding response OmpR family regulator
VSHKGTLLVVDDEPEVADLLRDFFEEQGYLVNSALNGRDALVLASLARPDAVILDIRMPDRSGPEVLRDLLGSDDSIAVVMLSGSDDEELARDLLRAGAFDYVRKPFTLDNLEQVVDLAVLVGKRRAMPEEAQPWLCDPRTFADETPSALHDTACLHCSGPVSGADATAVREREGLYHAVCWLGRAGDVTASARQLARS